MERAWKKKWRQRILSTVLCVGMAAQSLSGSVSAQGGSEAHRKIQTEEEHLEKQQELSDPEFKSAGTQDAEPESVETKVNETKVNETEANETEVIQPESVETKANETEIAETEVNKPESVETKANETEIAETEAIETEANETKVNETEANETEGIQTEANETENTETEPAETESADAEPAETEPTETESAETEPTETEPAETESADENPAETEEAERTETAEKALESEPDTLTLENGSEVTVEGVTKDRGQWIAFTAPEEGIYRFGWDYHEDDNASPAMCYLSSEILEDLAAIPEEPWKEELQAPLLSYDYGYGFRIEYQLSQGETVYLFVKLQNSDIPQTIPVYAKTVRAAIDISVDTAYQITDVNDDSAQWLVFQAPDSGFYEIRSSSPQADTTIEWEPYFDLYVQISGEYWGDDDNGTNLTFYAKEGQTRYIKARTMDDYENSHVKGSYQVTVTKLSGITFGMTAGMSKLTIDMETDSLGGIFPTIYYQKEGDSDWKSKQLESAVNASVTKSMDINGLEPDTAYTVEARFGYYREEEVVLYKETVRTKSMEDSYEQQANGYQIRWQAESIYGGFSLSAQITGAGDSAEVYFYTKQGEEDWVRRTEQADKEVALGSYKTWLVSGLDFEGEYTIGVSIKAPSAETVPPENTDVTALDGRTVTVELPKELEPVTVHTGCQFIVFQMPKALRFWDAVMVQEGREYEPQHCGEQTTSEGILSAWYIPLYEEWAAEYKDFQAEQAFDIKIEINQRSGFGWLVFKNQSLTQRPDANMLAAQISASAESVTYDMDSDKEPSMTIPVTLGTMPEDLHLIVTPARGFVSGTEIYYRWGKNYCAESDTHIDAKITGVDAGWNGKLAVCLRENMFLGMGTPSQKDDYMMRNQSNIFAEITVAESCTIPNSRRIITLNDTTTDAVTVRANITAGNVLEGERLYAYAKYWPSAQNESAGSYTEDVRLDSQNSYTGDLVFDTLTGDTTYQYCIYLYKEFETEDDTYRVNLEKDSRYTSTTGSADSLELKALSVTERYAGAADLFVSMSEKIESANMLTLYYREKGQQEWIHNENGWDWRCIIDEDGNAAIHLNLLKSATEYEYYIQMFGKKFSGENNSFYTRSAKEVFAGGTQILAQDDRASMTLEAVFPDKTVSAVIYYDLKDSQNRKQKLYLRTIKFDTFELCSDGLYRKTFDILKLEPDTAYEYEIIYYANEETGVRELFGEPETGMFTTLKKENDPPQFEIRPDDEKLVMTIPEFIYNHTRQEAKPVLIYDKRALEEGSDYDLFYSAEGDDYQSAGNHTVEVRFKGNYKGVVTKDYSILPRKVEDGDSKFAVSFPELYYNGAVQKAKPVLAYDNWKLAEQIDYTLSYPENGDSYTAVGEHEVILHFCGNYAGTVVQRYAIHARPAEYMGEELKIYVPSLYFNKKAQFPRPEVFYGTEKLIQGIDYSTEYPDKDSEGNPDDHKCIGNHALRIHLKGNYEGIVTQPYVIYDKRNAAKENTVDLGKLKFRLNASDVRNAFFTGSAVMPRVEVTGTDAKEDISYKVVYKNNYNAGKAAVTMIGLGRNAENDSTYIGTKTLSFTIKKPNVKNLAVNQYTDSYDYQGTPVRLKDLQLTLQGEQGVPDYVLKEGTDYAITYKKNSTAGTATAVVKGIGNFAGTVQYQFTIRPFTLKEADLRSAVTDVPYSPKGARLKKIVLEDGRTLTEGTDYKVKYTYSDRQKKMAGSTVTMVLTGKNACKGTVTLQDIPIVKADFSDCVTVPEELVLDAAKMEKGRTAVKVTDYAGVKLKNGRDYSLEWDSRETTAPKGTMLTLTIKPAQQSSYIGERSLSYRVAEKSLAKLKKIRIPEAKVFDGRHPVTLKPEDIVYGDRDAVAFTDEEIKIISYKNNTKAGTAQVTVQGTGRYYGTKTLRFKITD